METTHGETKMETLRITKLFLSDHQSRGLPMPEIVKETKSHYFLKVDWRNVGFMDLYKDAEYYVDEMTSGNGFEDAGLISSARSVLRNMETVKDHSTWEMALSGETYETEVPKEEPLTDEEIAEFMDMTLNEWVTYKKEKGW
tara:strand:+ start:5199 stop:5624 length:426 start_codon:yes stop_codon:yes gene_type:complete